MVKRLSPLALRIQKQQLAEQVRRGNLGYEKAMKKLGGYAQRGK